MISCLTWDVLALPVVAVPESAERLPLVPFLEDSEHTASLLALNCALVQRSMAHVRYRTTPEDQSPPAAKREHRDLLVEGTLRGHHQQGLAGIQGPRRSEGNHLLPPGYQGRRCCLYIPQTHRTQGWWCPRSRNHGGVRGVIIKTSQVKMNKTKLPGRGHVLQLVG